MTESRRCPVHVDVLMLPSVEACPVCEPESRDRQRGFWPDGDDGDPYELPGFFQS